MTRSGGGGRRVGMLACDCGGTTGLAWWCGQVVPGASLGATLPSGDFDWEQVEGGYELAGELAVARAIRDRWVGLAEVWSGAGVSARDRHLVIEEFTLRMRVGGTDRVGLSSARIGALVVGLLADQVDLGEMYFYGPAQTKRFATGDRLQKWGLWCRGAPHSRDAARLIAVHAAKCLDRSFKG